MCRFAFSVDLNVHESVLLYYDTFCSQIMYQGSRSLSLTLKSTAKIVVLATRKQARELQMDASRLSMSTNFLEGCLRMTLTFRLKVRRRRSSNVEAEQISQRNSWTNWKGCSMRHTIQTLSSAKRSANGSDCLRHESRLGHRLSHRTPVLSLGQWSANKQVV